MQNKMGFGGGLNIKEVLFKIKMNFSEVSCVPLVFLYLV